MKKIFLLFGLCGILISCTSKQTYYYINVEAMALNVHDKQQVRGGMYITFADSAFWVSDREGNPTGDMYSYLEKYSDIQLLFGHARYDYTPSNRKLCDSLMDNHQYYAYAFVTPDYRGVNMVAEYTSTPDTGSEKMTIVPLKVERWIKCAAPQSLHGEDSIAQMRIDSAGAWSIKGLKCINHEDYAQAAYWYGKAAEQGYSTAQMMLGKCYEEGKGREKDIAQAVYWYQQSAQNGNAQAQYSLGACYYHGDGVPKDGNTALYWFEKALNNKEYLENENVNATVIKKLQKEGYSSSRAKL
jgi:hypothetical protein